MTVNACAWPDAANPAPTAANQAISICACALPAIQIFALRTARSTTILISPLGKLLSAPAFPSPPSPRLSISRFPPAPKPAKNCACAGAACPAQTKNRAISSPSSASKCPRAFPNKKRNSGKRWRRSPNSGRGVESPRNEPTWEEQASTPQEQAKPRSTNQVSLENRFLVNLATEHGATL